MKTSLKTKSIPRLFTAGGLSWTTVLLCMFGAGNSVAASPAEKTHILYMGTNLSVEFEKKFQLVREVKGGSFVVDVKEKPTLVPMNLGAVNLKVEQSLKLSKVEANVADLKGDRAYTPGNDPRLQWQQAQSDVMLAIADNQSIAQTRQDAAASMQARREDRANGGSLDSRMSASLQQRELDNAAADMNLHAGDLSAATRMNQTSQEQSRSQLNTGGFYGGKMQEDLARENFDAMEISFSVSSKQPLYAPYVVIVARFHAAEDKPGTVRNWIYAQDLDRVGETPKKVKILKGGFPKGFVLENYEVHLYDGRLEIATNVAAKRVALTSDETFQYLLIEHLSRFKGKSTAATPVMADLPDDFPAKVSSAEGRREYNLKVSKEGRVLEVYLDNAQTQKLDDAYFLDVFQRIRFRPAVADGKAIDGVAKLKLSDLRLAL